MVKRVALTVCFTAVYLVTFATGSFLHPFGITRILGTRGLGVRLYIWDGVLLMLALFLLTIVIEALGRRLRDLAPWTTASLALAAALGYLLRLGFVSRDL